MNLVLLLIIAIVVIYFIKQKKAKDIEKDPKLIEKFNNYTLLYILNIIHNHFNEKNIWYIIIADTLDSVIERKDLPEFGDTGYILVNKGSENDIIGLTESFKKINLYVHVNINSIEIKTHFNKNISLMIYLVNNNNGILEMCSTKEHKECSTKCCKLPNSNIDYNKFSISYGDANPRKLYKIKNIELYGPNKLKIKKQIGCEYKKKVYNNNKHQLLLNDYINELSGKDNIVFSSTQINTKGMYKIPPLKKINGYNYHSYNNK